jgi:hypothetical protein
VEKSDLKTYEMDNQTKSSRVLENESLERNLCGKEEEKTEGNCQTNMVDLKVIEALFVSIESKDRKVKNSSLLKKSGEKINNSETSNKLKNKKCKIKKVHLRNEDTTKINKLKMYEKTNGMKITKSTFQNLNKINK